MTKNEGVFTHLHFFVCSQPLQLLHSPCDRQLYVSPVNPTFLTIIALSSRFGQKRWVTSLNTFFLFVSSIIPSENHTDVSICRNAVLIHFFKGWKPLISALCIAPKILFFMSGISFCNSLSLFFIFSRSVFPSAGQVRLKVGRLCFDAK